METKHRYVIGGLFFAHGLILTLLSIIVLSFSVEMNFSSVMVSFACAIPSLMGGYNLLTSKPQAHTILFIAALITLFDFPYGTVLSIYYYWFWKYQCGAPNPLAEIFSKNKALVQ